MSAGVAPGHLLIEGKTNATAEKVADFPTSQIVFTQIIMGLGLGYYHVVLVFSSNAHNQTPICRLRAILQASQLAYCTKPLLEKKSGYFNRIFCLFLLYGKFNGKIMLT